MGHVLGRGEWGAQKESAGSVGGGLNSDQLVAREAAHMGTAGVATEAVVAAVVVAAETPGMEELRAAVGLGTSLG